MKRIHMLRPGAIAALALTLASLTGCQTPPPQYGQRPLTSEEYGWYQTMTDWYPNWQEPVRPVPPRGTEPQRMPTVDQPNNPQPAPARIVAPPPPVAATPAPPANTAPPKPPTPAVRPVFDFPDQRDAAPAGSQPFRIIPEGAAPDKSRPQWYSVQKGDTLASIAKRFYGNAGAWRNIYQANRQTLTAPDQLKIGMRLRLP